ncbi:UNVERIFIED_CONTAM: hypothetical protein FKN15_054797 [Acipenser sinensis]
MGGLHSAVLNNINTTLVDQSSSPAWNPEHSGRPALRESPSEHRIALTPSGGHPNLAPLRPGLSGPVCDERINLQWFTMSNEDKALELDPLAHP